VTNNTDQDAGYQLDPEKVEQWGKDIKLLYYILWGILLSFAFLWLPWALFFYAEKGDGTRTIKQRCCKAFMYTIGFIVILPGLFVVGFYILNDTSVKNWNNVTDQFNHKGQRTMEFMIAICTVIGMIGQVTYTAYGLAILPITVTRDWQVVMSSQGRDWLNIEITTLERSLQDIDRKRSKSHTDEMRYKRISDQLERFKRQRQFDHLREKCCYFCMACL
jgi:hypothetical protein